MPFAKQREEVIRDTFEDVIEEFSNPKVCPIVLAIKMVLFDFVLTIDNMLDVLSGSEWRSTLDLKSDYW